MMLTAVLGFVTQRKVCIKEVYGRFILELGLFHLFSSFCLILLHIGATKFSLFLLVKRS